MLFELNEEVLKRRRKIFVIGDLHGDYNSFKSGVDQADLDQDFLIFLGDYADRGKYGIEIIEHLHSYLVKYPQSLVALKGNHEIYSDDGIPAFNPCDLIDEAERKRSGWDVFFNRELKPFFSRLYTAAIIPGKALFVHAGITGDITSLKDLKTPSAELEKNLLWSDATDDEIYESPNFLRGTGKIFGPKLTQSVCENLGIRQIIRSHEPRKAMEGPHYQHDKRVVTISSTSVYGGKPHMLVFNNEFEYLQTIYL